MHAPDPNYRKVVEAGFREAAFLSEPGIKLVESEVFAIVGDRKALISKQSATMAVLPRTKA